MAFDADMREPITGRARFGGLALVAWRAAAPAEPEMEWQVAECIADLLHLARGVGVNPERALERAAYHFRREADQVAGG